MKNFKHLFKTNVGSFVPTIVALAYAIGIQAQDFKLTVDTSSVKESM